MSRGRPQKSNAERLAEGNRGKRPIVGEDFVVSPGIPERPKGLSRLARREWAQITEMLFAKGGLTPLDGKALAAYCEAYARAEEANKLIDKYGPMVPVYCYDKETGMPLKDSEGVLIVKEWRRNPATMIHKDYLMVQRAYLEMFGLSPKSRMALKLGDKPKKSSLADFMAGKPVAGFQAGADNPDPVIRPGRPFVQPAAPAVNEKPAVPEAPAPQAQPPVTNEPLKI